ncbi:MAG: hypothetical protein AAFR61_31375 [Bacteroidota bacterium]
MKKLRTLLVLCGILTGNILIAQQAMEGSYAFNKRIAESANGISLLVEGDPVFVEAALKDLFALHTKEKAKGVKKGLFMYEGVVIPSITDATLNYYYRLEQPNKAEAKTLVTLFLSPGHDNFYTSDKFGPEMEAAGKMLQSLDFNTQIKELEATIMEQEKVIEEEEKAMTGLEKNLQDLLKEKEKLNKALAENKTKQDENLQEQEKQMLKAQVEKIKLQDLKAQLQTLKQR